MRKSTIVPILILILAASIAYAGDGEWYDGCPVDSPTPTPWPVQPTYTPNPTYTPRPTPTCRPTATPAPTEPPPTPYPTATPYPTSTPYPTQLPQMSHAGADAVHVTTLAASGAGSLREALDVEEPREIVFDVGGIIWLTQDLVVIKPFVTIAGETAPSPGITLAGAGLRIRTHDVEVRHLRIRVGDLPEGPSPESRDGIRISPGADPYEAYNVVIDHCSISWAVDENMSTWASKVSDVTIRNCIISEGLQHSIHPKGAHSCGLLVGDHARRVVVVGNLFAHNSGRNPCLKGDTESVVVNNVLYNTPMAIHSQDPENSGLVDTSVVGNVLLPGPDWAEPRIRFYSSVKQGSRVYLSDNPAPREPRFDTPFDPRVDSPPWWPNGLAALPSDKVLDWVLANAGARPWDRDAVDWRIISDVLNGTGRIIDSQDEVGGWE